MPRITLYLSVALFVLLVASNIWWVHVVADQVATQKANDQMLYEYQHEISALKRACLELNPSSTRRNVMELMSAIEPGSSLYQKHGLLNSTWLSFRFNADNRLVEIITRGDVSNELPNGTGGP